MPNAERNPGFDWSRLRPTRRRLWIVASVWAGIAVATTLTIYGLTALGRTNTVIGGDFTAFYAAATATVAGDPSDLYDRGYFQSLLAKLFPTRQIKLSWQYPPTYLLLTFPFAFLPYVSAFAVWSIGTAFGLFAVMRKLICDRLILFAVFASPASFFAFVTGQNGFFTAILISLGVVYPRERPMLAGAAAGLLTMKPQLGLLIPVAFIAAGHWRAFIIAAITAVVLVVTSLTAFGAETWQAFLISVRDVASALDAQRLPLGKMVTLYSAAMSVGLPLILVKVVYLASAGLCVFLVWTIWRKGGDQILLASTVVACIFIVAPYGFYYELIVLALPLAMIAERASKTGWLSYERWMLGAAVVLPLGINRHIAGGSIIGFAAVLLVFIMTVRRARHEAASAT